MNAAWGGDKIIRRGHVHVGLAVALEAGLIVPVVRHADRKSVGQITAESRDLAARARDGKLISVQRKTGAGLPTPPSCSTTIRPNATYA